MSRFDPALALRTLVDAEVRFVVVGQVAASLRGDPETTVDLDVLAGRPKDLARLPSLRAFATRHPEA